MDGIGDTIRVSLTADPVKEVETAWDILKSLGLRERGPVMIACPSCGRDNVGVEQLAETVAGRLAAYPEAFEVAVMGCAVNGPGEAGDADFGIAGGRDVGFIYAHGRVLRKVSSESLIDELFNEIDTLDRRRHAAPEAPEARQAGGAPDGRGGAAPGRRAGARNSHRVACPRGPRSSSSRRFGMLPPKPRRSATSCSSAGASCGR